VNRRALRSKRAGPRSAKAESMKHKDPAWRVERSKPRKLPDGVTLAFNSVETRPVIRFHGS